MIDVSRIAPQIRLRLFFALTASLLLGACAPKIPSLVHDDSLQAAVTWSRFQNTFLEHCRVEHFSLRASVNFSSPERHSRLIISMWGKTDFPIRLDVQAGVGAMLAHWREEHAQWIGYVPSAQEAYIADSVQSGARMTGLFMPMRLNVLAQLLLGCWQPLMPPTYETVRQVGNNLEFTTALDATAVILILSPDGRPISIRNPGDDGWLVNVDQWESDSSPIPRRISLVQENQSAVIRIQRLELDIQPWGEGDLLLDIPPGTTLWSIPG